MTPTNPIPEFDTRDSTAEPENPAGKPVDEAAIYRPLSFWSAIAVRQGAWWQLCKVTRMWEFVSPIGVLWWAWLLLQPGGLFQTNAGFADLAAYAPETTWGLWAGIVAGSGVLSASLGPPVVRALALASQMWLWTMIAIHLAAAAPHIYGWIPFSTGAGVYALFAAASCFALALLVPLVINDVVGFLRRAKRQICRICRRHRPHKANRAKGAAA